MIAKREKLSHHRRIMAETNLHCSGFQNANGTHFCIFGHSLQGRTIYRSSSKFLVVDLRFACLHCMHNAPHPLFSQQIAPAPHSHTPTEPGLFSFSPSSCCTLFFRPFLADAQSIDCCISGLTIRWWLVRAGTMCVELAVGAGGWVGDGW